MTAPDGLYWRGVLLTGLGALVLSPDATLFKLLDSGFWTSAFWRLTLLFASIALYLVWRHGSGLGGLIRALGWALPAAALAMSFSNIGFLYALTHSPVADTLAIIATAPIFTALLAMALGERPPLRTWIAAAAVAIGIAIIFDASFHAGDLRGNLGALTAAVSISFYFIACRQRRQLDMAPALALSAALSAAVAALLAPTLTPAASDWPLLMALGFFVLPVSFLLITFGPKRLPAAEVGLLLLLETTFGPLWAWLFVHEVPSRTTLMGGGLVLGALALHSFAALLQRGRTA